jgi:hypothetical protein
MRISYERPFLRNKWHIVCAYVKSANLAQRGPEGPILPERERGERAKRRASAP